MIPLLPKNCYFISLLYLIFLDFFIIITSSILCIEVLYFLCKNVITLTNKDEL